MAPENFVLILRKFDCFKLNCHSVGVGFGSSDDDLLFTLAFNVNRHLKVKFESQEFCLLHVDCHENYF